MKICLAFHDKVLFLLSHSTLRIHPVAESLFLTSLSTLEKTTEGFQNQSLCTARVITICERESNRNSTTSSIPMQNFCFPGLSCLQDEAESFLPSTPSSSRAIAPTLMSDPVYVDSPIPLLDDGDMKVCTADTPSIRPASFLPTIANPENLSSTFREYLS